MPLNRSPLQPSLNLDPSVVAAEDNCSGSGVDFGLGVAAGGAEGHQFEGITKGIESVGEGCNYVGASTRSKQPLSVAQECGHLLDFQSTFENVHDYKTFKPPIGKVSAITRKKNELMNLLNKESAFPLHINLVKEKLCEFVQKCENLFQDLEIQKKCLNSVEIETLIKWSTIHRDEFIRIKRLVENYLREKEK